MRSPIGTVHLNLVPMTPSSKQVHCWACAGCKLRSAETPQRDSARRTSKASCPLARGGTEGGRGSKEWNAEGLGPSRTLSVRPLRFANIAGAAETAPALCQTVAQSLAAPEAHRAGWLAPCTLLAGPTVPAVRLAALASFYDSKSLPGNLSQSWIWHCFVAIGERGPSFVGKETA